MVGSCALSSKYLSILVYWWTRADQKSSKEKYPLQMCEGLRKEEGTQRLDESLLKQALPIFILHLLSFT